eukprot:3018603-Prymnesium_polylepis.1
MHAGTRQGPNTALSPSTAGGKGGKHQALWSAPKSPEPRRERDQRVEKGRRPGPFDETGAVWVPPPRAAGHRNCQQ